MNRFNLTFKGEILLGRKPEQVKLRFAKLFAINDPVRLEQFFTGETIILRRNLDRKTAADYFQKMRKLGVAAELVKVTTKDAVEAIAETTAEPARVAPEDNTTTAQVRGMDSEILKRSPGQVDQSWAVSANSAQRPPGKIQSKATRNAARRKATKEAARKKQERLEREAAEAASKRQAELAEEKRKKAEEAARLEALREEAKRKAAEEVARERALREEAQRKAAEEAARQKALREEAERKAAEEAARQQALREEAQRKAAEEAARQKALREEAKRKAAEEAARQKVLREEAERKAAEEAARQKVLREEAERKAAEEAERKAAEEAARQKALREEAKRKAAEEAARQKALREEAKRKAAEEAARQKALREEAERKAAEEAARQKALREEAERKAAEEAARQKALREEAARKEAARRKAERAERKRKKAEEAARIKAEKRRKKAAERARLEKERALEAARKKAIQEEAKRKAAEEAARQQAMREEAERKAAEEAARVKTEQARERYQAAEEAARKQAIVEEAKRKAAAEAAELTAKLDEQARQAGAEVAQLRAEQQCREAESKARIAAEREKEARQEQEQTSRLQSEAAAEAAAKQALRKKEKRKAASLAARKKATKAAETSQQIKQAAGKRVEEQRSREEQQDATKAEQADQLSQRKAMEELAVQRAAAELSQQPSLKPGTARVRSNLELPLRHSSSTPGKPAAKRRQSGEPNLYSLRPFRNTPEVRARAEQSHRRMRHSFAAALLALAVLLILAWGFLGLPRAQPITGASALAIDAQAGPLLLAGDNLLFHDRAGVGSSSVALESLGLSALQAPMLFNTAGDLFALGRLNAGNAQHSEIESLQLLRCELPESRCKAFSSELANSRITSFAIHPLDGTVLMADATASELVKADSHGTVVARGTAALPENPVMQLRDGLLFINSSTGPAVSVFRYDDNAFAQQLDEILLLPPAAMEAGQSRVGEFVWSADSWWVSMYNPETGNAALYRFDTQWNFLDRIDLPEGTSPQQLANWGEKTLVGDARHIPVQRFNKQGIREVPLTSALLENLVDQQKNTTSLAGLAWRASLLLCGIIVLSGLCTGYLQRLRSLVYKPDRERGADPVDEYADVVHWIDPVSNRRSLLRHRQGAYALLAMALILFAIAQSIPTVQLVALLIALSGPAIALVILGKTPVGHIGCLNQQLLLVDHTGMYHLGGGPNVQYRGPFLLIDDVLVFAGTKLFPAFSPAQLETEALPLAKGGIKVDRKTVMVKLLQARHPLAQGAVAMLSSASFAAVLLCLQRWL